MRIASVAKLRALLVISCLSVGVASLGFWFQPPVSVGQEPGSDLPANWQALNASDFAALTESYLLSANPQASSRKLLLQHAWNSFLSPEAAASELNDALLDRLLGIINLRSPESRQIVMDGRTTEEQTQLLSRWRDLQTRYTNSTVSKLSQSESLTQLLDDVQKLREDYGEVSVSSPVVGQQVGEWVAAHESEVEDASSEELLVLLELLQGVVPDELGLVYETWMTPQTSGTYNFTQLLHGAQEGSMSISVNDQVVFDSGKDEDRFDSTPIALTAGQATRVEVTYAFDRSQLITANKLTRDAGTTKWPIFPVAAVLWKTGDQDFQLIPEGLIKTTAQGTTTGVAVSQYSDAERTALQFETTQAGLGDVFEGVKTTLNKWEASQAIADILLQRDLTEMFALDSPSGDKPTIGTLVGALTPEAAFELVTEWTEQPNVLESLNRETMADIASSIYLLPEDVLVDFLVAWSDARTGYEDNLTPEARWSLLSPGTDSTRSFGDFQNEAYDSVGAKLAGSYQLLFDALLPHLVDDEGMARIPLIKIALYAASANYRLDEVVGLLESQLDEFPPSDEKASWLLAQAYFIEAKEMTIPHPQAVAKLEEVLLVADSEPLKRLALLEALSRLMKDEAKFNQLVGANSSLLSAEFIATVKSSPPPLPGGREPNEAEMAKSQTQVRNAILQQRLEKARQNGNQALIAKYERMLNQ